MAHMKTFHKTKQLFLCVIPFILVLLLPVLPVNTIPEWVVHRPTCIILAQMSKDSSIKAFFCFTYIEACQNGRKHHTVKLLFTPSPVKTALGWSKQDLQWGVDALSSLATSRTSGRNSYNCRIIQELGLLMELVGLVGGRIWWTWRSFQLNDSKQGPFAPHLRISWTIPGMGTPPLLWEACSWSNKRAPTRRQLNDTQGFESTVFQPLEVLPGRGKFRWVCYWSWKLHYM